ncbi:protein D2 [Drosophila virilis]|uniref:Uncharacterized protein n=1 Tax=Drosophila virilis TaxID=7244 RepID=B4MBN6_DROVI|nr:protein D2 [Drosophila virilis]EDW58507.1 uncharacterized protein Dvir_GJ14270 [Drosophila virilis]
MWTKCSRLLCLCLCVGQCLSVFGNPAETNVSKFLRHLDVIPDLIDVGPQEFLNVTYMGNIRADRGVELQPLQVRDEPTVQWIAGKDDYYTLLMTDPDVPEKMYPQLKEYLHWLVVNIPGGQMSLGDVRVGYVGATPPKGSGLHRYVFLLYKQPDYLKFDIEHVPRHSESNRVKFSTRAFVLKYNLGFPLAGNFFTSEWSKEVPSLHKALQTKGETLSF